MKVIERHLEHGDWHNGERTAPLQATGAIAHAMSYQIDITQDVLDYYGAHVGTLGERVYAAEWLDRIKRSAHVLIPPGGEIIRCRRDDQVAWHAKAQGHNFKSLGAEFLIPGVYTYGDFLQAIREPGWITDEQLETGTDLYVHWARTRGFGTEQILRHSDIDNRKHDPGDGFPWQLLMHRVARRL